MLLNNDQVMALNGVYSLLNRDIADQLTYALTLTDRGTMGTLELSDIITDTYNLANRVTDLINRAYAEATME